jgi:hypothetical protein
MLLQPSSPDDEGSFPLDSVQGVHSPMESFSHYHGADWTPEQLAFHQNLEQFAERVGLIVGLQGNGKMTQEDAYANIRGLLSELRSSRSQLLH